MMLQMDAARIIQVYVFQLGMGIFFLLIALLILKRDRKRLNVIFSAFFLCIFLGTLVNVIYAPLNVNPAVLFLHLITDFLLFLSVIFLLIFNSASV